MLLSTTFTVRLLFKAVVPVPAPRLRVVAAPNALTVVAVALRRLNVVAVVVRSPPFTARSPVAVTFPVSNDVPSTVSVPFA